jgi:hypothetical protein
LGRVPVNATYHGRVICTFDLKIIIENSNFFDGKVWEILLLFNGKLRRLPGATNLQKLTFLEFLIIDILICFY